MRLDVTLPPPWQICIRQAARQLLQKFLRCRLLQPVVRHLPQATVVRAQNEEHPRVSIPLLPPGEEPSRGLEHQAVRDVVRPRVLELAKLEERRVGHVERAPLLLLRSVGRRASADHGGVAGDVRPALPNAAGRVHSHLPVEDATSLEVVPVDALGLGPVVDDLVVHDGVRPERLVPPDRIRPCTRISCECASRTRRPPT